jgi:hybrid cluster-associated redox disulfide protein
MPKKSEKKESKEPKKEVKAENADKITKDMTLGDIIQKKPQSALIMMEYGLHCIGCHVATWETLEQGSLAHGLDDKQIDEMVEKINKMK